MIKLENICWTAPDGKQVLDNINLSIPENRLVAVSGPNGSGKTTLARILAGIEKPTSGRIFFKGQDITELDITERAKLGISLGFQQPVSFKGIRVRRLLSLAAGRDVSEQELCGILQQVGLCAKNYIDREMDSTLSGGESKRIEIATVLARNSSLMLFDEPEAGIDLWSFEKLIDVFDKMRGEAGHSIVIISHQERILNIADEIVLISEGRVSDSGPGPEMLDKMLRSGGRISHSCGLSEVKFNG